MDHQVRVNLDKLQTSIIRLIDELRYKHGSSALNLKRDNYWKLDPHEKYDMTSVPKNLLSGRVKDDIEMTENIDSSYERVALYALSEIAEILLALAEESVD